VHFRRKYKFARFCISFGQYTSDFESKNWKVKLRKFSIELLLLTLLNINNFSSDVKLAWNYCTELDEFYVTFIA